MKNCKGNQGSLTTNVGRWLDVADANNSKDASKCSNSQGIEGRHSRTNARPAVAKDTEQVKDTHRVAGASEVSSAGNETEPVTALGETNAWGERYVQLLAFVRRHGPAAVDMDRVLGPWALTQRKLLSSRSVRTETLKERRALLDHLLLDSATDVSPMQRQLGQTSHLSRGSGMVGATGECASSVCWLSLLCWSLCWSTIYSNSHA